MKFIPQIEPLVRKKWAKAVYKQIRSGWIGPGKATIAFEDEIKKIHNVQHAIATTSGTAALMLAISALNISKDKIILCPNYGFLAGANTAKYLGYKVELIDIDKDSLCMCQIELDKTKKNR